MQIETAGVIHIPRKVGAYRDRSAHRMPVSGAMNRPLFVLGLSQPECNGGAWLLTIPENEGRVSSELPYYHIYLFTGKFIKSFAIIKISKFLILA